MTSTIAKNTETRSRAGRPGVLDNRQSIYDNLVKVRDNDDDAPSRYITLKLVDAGYLSPKDVKGEGRGRPRKEYKLTRKATDFIRRENKKTENMSSEDVNNEDEESFVEECKTEMVEA